MYQTGSYSEDSPISIFKVLRKKTNSLNKIRNYNNIWGIVKYTYLRVPDETPAL